MAITRGLSSSITSSNSFNAKTEPSMSTCRTPLDNNEMKMPQLIED